MNATTLKAFVIGPIGDREASDGSEGRTAYEEGVQIFEEVIIPACNGFGIDAIRADMISTTGEIPEQIFRQLRDCALVIADLTGANPNVMYELGLRHTTGKLTIQIGEREKLPFDVAAIRTIMFKRSEAGLVQARKDLAKALAANLDTGGSPVTATRIWFESSIAGELASLVSEAQGADDGDSPGFLELLAETEDGMQSLAQTLNGATSIAVDISRVYEEATASVRQADAHGGGAAARLAVADRTATMLDPLASRIEVVAGDYERTVLRIEPGLDYLFSRLAETPEQYVETPDFPIQFQALVNAARTTIDGALVIRQNALEMGKASRSLRRVGQRLGDSFKKMADVSSRIASWSGLLDRLPKP